MNNVISGLILVGIGFFLGFITFKKTKLFWDFLNMRIIRKYLGDNLTSVALYFISIVLIVVGLLLSLSIVQ